jgi:hypothetical protein
VGGPSTASCLLGPPTPMEMVITTLAARHASNNNDKKMTIEETRGLITNYCSNP